jgi:4'-phosphopantetheinyl transferase
MLPLFPWCPPPDSVSLEPCTVHLWRVRLEIAAPTSASLHSPWRGTKLSELEAGSPSELDELFLLLSPDEQARAKRLRIPEKARAFIVSRARLRQILARYLDRVPAELAFTYGPHDKPALAAYDRGLHFNLAHSGDWMLLAITNSGPVGVDLEGIDHPGLDFVSLARRYFSSAEQEILMQAPPWRRRRTFYRLWTRKEAYLKGRGGGFAGVGEDVVRSGWRTWNFFVGRDYVAALAVEGEKVESIRCWEA